MGQSLVHLWTMLRTWWDGRSMVLSGDTACQEGPATSNVFPCLQVNGQGFETCLHTSCVHLEDHSSFLDSPGKEGLTLLQRSQHSDGISRVDLVAGHPHLLVLFPQADLHQFEGYLVQLRLSHPLFGILVLLVFSQGSAAFEQGRGEREEQMFFTLEEAMKFLFWAGVESSGQFPT